jgi:hypothetical protein
MREFRGARAADGIDAQSLSRANDLEDPETKEVILSFYFRWEDFAECFARK